MVREVIGKVSEYPPGTRKVVSVRGREIVVFNVNGELFALLNKCPHEGAELCHGVLVGLTVSHEPGKYLFSRDGEMLRCPWHGWEFDIRTGQSWYEPKKVRVKSYPVAIEDAMSDQAESTEGNKLHPGPYMAETFPVSVQEKHVVVEL